MKKIFLILCILFVGVSLGGCQKKNVSTTSSQGPSLLQGKDYILEIWATKDVSFLEALLREYIALKKERGLTAIVIQFSSEEEMQDELVEALAEGGGPDLVYTNGQWVAQNTKKLLSATNTPTFNTDLFISNFVRSATNILVQDGAVWGVPLGVDTLAVLYNEDHLINGLKDRYEPGATWEAFQKDVELLSKPNNSFERFLISGAAIGRADNTFYMFDIFENMYAQLGGTFFSPDKKRAIFASQRGVSADGTRRTFSVEALQFLTYFGDSRHKSYTWSEFMADSNDPQREYTPFVQGRVSMVFGYARDLKRIEALIESGSRLFGRGTISKNNLRVGLLPQFNDPNKSADRAAVARIDSLAVTKGSQYPLLAWNFLDFAIGKDNLRSFFETTGVPSPRLDLISEQESTPNIGTFVRQAKFAQSYHLPLKRSFIEQSFIDGIGLINERKASVNEALLAIEKSFNVLLGRIKTRDDEILKTYKTKHSEDNDDE